MIPFTRRSINALLYLALAGLIVLTAATIRATDQPATNGLPIMLNAASASNATGTSMGTGTMTRCREVAIYIQWSSLTSSGGVQVETAHDVNYTGTWAPLGAAVAWSAASKEDVVQITGIHGAIRTRISTVIGGGTVSSWLVCN